MVVVLPYNESTQGTPDSRGRAYRIDMGYDADVARALQGISQGLGAGLGGAARDGEMKSARASHITDAKAGSPCVTQYHPNECGWRYSRWQTAWVGGGEDV